MMLVNSLRSSVLFVFGVLLCLGVPTAARATTLVLRNGGRISGEIAHAPERTRKVFEIRTTSGATVTVAEEAVREVLDPKNMLPKYEEFLLKMPATADGNWKMADWCLKQELGEERIHHLRKVIELEPDHAEARLALGYKKAATGAWENPDEQLMATGYNKVKNRFKTQHEIEIDDANAQLEVAHEAAVKQIGKLHNKANRGAKDQNEALAQIRAIEDPIALDVLVSNYLMQRGGNSPSNNLPSPELKKVYIEVVAKKLSYKGAGVLVNIALNDPVENIRDFTMQKLVEAKHPATTSLFLQQIGKGIKDNNQQLVNDAARALGRLNAEEAVFPLIAALITKVRTQSDGGPGGISASPTFGSDGSTGLSSGGKKPIIEYEVKNAGVLEALNRLTKQDFQYDMAAWKNWYISSNTPNVQNMRRDE